MHRESQRRTNASSPGLPAADAPVVLSVSGFHQRLARAIEAAHLRRVWLRGTVSGVRTRGRVVTFELVEYVAGTAAAVLPMTLFSNDALRVERRLAAGASELVEGLEATFLVELEGNGAFGIVRGVVRDARPDAEHSRFSQNREALLARLRASDSFGQRRLRVPSAPSRVGLITSAGGAGGGDVEAVLADRGVDLRVHRVDVAMSGHTAPAQVAEAISRLERKRLDVILLARGGGSRADLAAWDSPEIAAAIAECATPVWTALGHAHDQTIADLVAQRSFVSPAAAAAELRRDRHGRSERVVDDEAWVSSHTRVRVALAVACVIIVVLAVALVLR